MQSDKLARRRKARRTLLVLALVCAAPVLASYVAYYGWRPQARTNYGELLEPGAVPDITGVQLDGAPFRFAELRGRWVVLLAADRPGCDSRCERMLYATRQARTMQGREQDRVVRVLLLPEGASAPAAELLAAHPGMIVVHANPQRWAALSAPSGAAATIYLVDPHGNPALRYPADPDIRGLAKDLERVLLASRIG